MTNGKIINLANFARVCLFFAAVLLNPVQAFALSSESAEQKAGEIASVALSDAVYAQDINKALYYQNIQIINLLGEIKDLLRENLNRETKQ